MPELRERVRREPADRDARWELARTYALLGEHQQASPDAPFFAWVHLFDPHAPYDPPEPFRTRYASNLYDGEVAFTDQQVGRLVDKLDELDLLDKTILVLVGDHGEGLGDHGESTHSLLIYGATMKVPLIVYGPGLIPAGRVVNLSDLATETMIVMSMLKLVMSFPSQWDSATS